jgi:hypothetical protein
VCQGGSAGFRRDGRTLLLGCRARLSKGGHDARFLKTASFHGFPRPRSRWWPCRHPDAANILTLCSAPSQRKVISSMRSTEHTPIFKTAEAVKASNVRICSGQTASRNTVDSLLCCLPQQPDSGYPAMTPLIRLVTAGAVYPATSAQLPAG